MNIFVLDLDPLIAAKYHCDKHVVKMTLETAQLLSSAHRVTKSPYADSLYALTHANHPCSIWVRASEENYLWTLELFNSLSNEYTRRYGKTHLSFKKYSELFKNIPNIPKKGLTPFARCFSKHQYAMDIVSAYRQFYIDEKSSFAVWKDGEIPDWYTKGLYEKEVKNK
jgi:hypothetical protein